MAPSPVLHATVRHASRASLRGMMRLMAQWIIATPVSGSLSWSLLILLFWSIHEKVRSMD